MEKLNKKLNWAIGLSIAAIALSGVMFVLWCCQAGGFSAVNLDTFVGVIVALLAIIVTFAIGWQIWAAMDMKSNIEKLDSRIQEVENIREKFKEQEQKMNELHSRAQHFSQLAIAETYKNRGDFVNAFRFYMSSLKCGLRLTKSRNSLPILESMSECANSIVGPINLPEAVQVGIISNDKDIRKTHLFGVVQSRYEQVYSEFKSKVKLNDDQK